MTETKKEAFRRYLESAGAIDTLTKVLVNLYEEPGAALLSVASTHRQNTSFLNYLMLCMWLASYFVSPCDRGTIPHDDAAEPNALLHARRSTHQGQ